MKTVKSLSDLKQSALAQGATVSVGGRQFNASGETAKIVAMPQAGAPKAAPAPEPVKEAPAPQQAAEPVNNIHVDMAPVAQAQVQIGQILAQALAAMPKPTDQVRSWEFTVARDANGYITTINATAKE